MAVYGGTYATRVVNQSLRVMYNEGVVQVHV